MGASTHAAVLHGIQREMRRGEKRFAHVPPTRVSRAILRRSAHALFGEIAEDVVSEGEVGADEVQEPFDRWLG
jgi:hypothetical protein